MKSKFRLFKRKNKKIWYFNYYDDDGNRRSLSTGHESKIKADKYAEDFVNSNLKEKTHQLTLAEYAKDFYVWDKCVWIKKNLQAGKTILKATVKNYRFYLEKYILTEFGHFYLSEINPVRVENWIIKSSLSSEKARMSLRLFKQILNQAQKEQLIKYNPLLSIKPVRAKNEKRKSGLSLDEIKRLFPKNKNKLIEIWDTFQRALFFYTMLSTGMRTGEVRALQWDSVLLDEQAIIIKRAINKDHQVSNTKSKQVRAAFLPARTISLLKIWKKETPYNRPDDFVFFIKKRYKPINTDQPREHFYSALSKAGIDRTGRYLTPHSLRHTYNTLTRGIISPEMLRFQIGHQSEAMTDLYDRADPFAKLIRFEGERDKVEGVF